MKMVFLNKVFGLSFFSPVTLSAYILVVSGSLASQAMADQAKLSCATPADTVIPEGQIFSDLSDGGFKGKANGSPISIRPVSGSSNLFEITHDYGHFLNEIGERDFKPGRDVSWTTAQFSVTQDEKISERTLVLAQADGLTDVKVYDLNYSNCGKLELTLFKNSSIEKHRLVVSTRADGAVTYKLVIVDSSATPLKALSVIDLQK